MKKEFCQAGRQEVLVEIISVAGRVRVLGGGGISSHVMLKSLYLFSIAWKDLVFFTLGINKLFGD